jgi:hypothetical protein
MHGTANCGGAVQLYVHRSVITAPQIETGCSRASVTHVLDVGRCRCAHIAQARKYRNLMRTVAHSTDVTHVRRCATLGRDRSCITWEESALESTQPKQLRSAAGPTDKPVVFVHNTMLEMGVRVRWSHLENAVTFVVQHSCSEECTARLTHLGSRGRTFPAALGRQRAGSQQRFRAGRAKAWLRPDS